MDKIWSDEVADDVRERSSPQKWSAPGESKEVKVENEHTVGDFNQ